MFLTSFTQIGSDVTFQISKSNQSTVMKVEMIWFCVDSLNMEIAPEPPSFFFLSSIIQTIFALKFELKT